MFRPMKSALSLSVLVLAFVIFAIPLHAQVNSFSRSTGGGGDTDIPHEALVRVSPEVQGDLLLARGEYAAAISAYKDVEPRTAVTWNKLGIAYHHLFAVDEALKDYKTAIALDPHYSGAYNNLGAVYHSKHDFAQAEKAYKFAIKYDSHAAVAYYNLGTTYFAESKYKKGMKSYQKAMQIDPGVFNPARSNRIEEGSSRAQRMAIAYYLAEVYASSGRNDEAVESLRRAFSHGFDDRKRLMEDKELAALRGTPAFHALLVENQWE
jgi:tetratricopeptide (TPR) repeat protein